MTESAELIEKINAEIERTERLLRESVQELAEAERDSRQRERELEDSDAETEAALKTLRRAGLLPA